MWESALVLATEEEIRHYRMDVVWGYLGSMKSANSTIKLLRLSRVAQLVLTLQHSNAEDERVFSLINKNKTNFQQNLSFNETLSSIITVKLANPKPSAKFEPPPDVIQTAVLIGL